MWCCRLQLPASPTHTPALPAAPAAQALGGNAKLLTWDTLDEYKAVVDALTARSATIGLPTFQVGYRYDSAASKHKNVHTGEFVLASLLKWYGASDVFDEFVFITPGGFRGVGGEVDGQRGSASCVGPQYRSDAGSRSAPCRRLQRLLLLLPVPGQLQGQRGLQEAAAGVPAGEVGMGGSAQQARLGQGRLRSTLCSSACTAAWAGSHSRAARESPAHSERPLPPPPPATQPPSSPPPPTCKAASEGCELNSECCAPNLCSNAKCTAPTCKTFGGDCETSEECCAPYACVNAKCTE